MGINKDKPYELSHKDDEDIPVFEGAVTFQGNYEPMDEYYENNCDDVEVKRETDEESTAKTLTKTPAMITLLQLMPKNGTILPPTGAGFSQQTTNTSTTT